MIESNIKCYECAKPLTFWIDDSDRTLVIKCDCGTTKLPIINNDFPVAFSTGKCIHRFQQWLGFENGTYRLCCTICGEFLGQETFLPGNLEIFENKPPDLGVSVIESVGTKDRTA